MKTDMKIFLGGIMKGSPSSRARHLMQANSIQSAIEQRWELKRVEHWKAKHLRWFLTEQLKNASQETSYRYWLTTRIILQRLDKVDDWLPHLKGPWTRKTSPLLLL